MLLHEISLTLRVVKEGGNVFKNKKGEILTQRISQADIEPTVHWLEKITSYEHLPHLLGTTGTKTTSNDIDIGMPPGADKDELINKLSIWCGKNKMDPKDCIKKSGVSVHFKTPVGGSPDRGFVQTDFMFVPNLEFAKFSMVADPNSEYKNASKQVVLSSIAKHAGYKWSPSKGLLNRETNELISDQPDDIAHMLFGKEYNRSVLTSVESALRALENNPDSDAMLADARETLGKQGITI